MGSILWGPLLLGPNFTLRHFSLDQHQSPSFTLTLGRLVEQCCFTQCESVSFVFDIVASSFINSSSFSVKASQPCEVKAFECKTNMELLFLELEFKKKNPNSAVLVNKDFHRLYASIKERKHLNLLSNMEKMKCRAADVYCAKIREERPNVAMPTSHPPLCCFAWTDCI